VRRSTGIAGELGGSSFQPREVVGMLREVQQDRLHDSGES
jgi:hypothetical protein